MLTMKSSAAAASRSVAAHANPNVIDFCIVAGRPKRHPNNPANVHGEFQKRRNTGIGFGLRCDHVEHFTQLLTGIRLRIHLHSVSTPLTTFTCAHYTCVALRRANRLHLSSLPCLRRNETRHNTTRKLNAAYHFSAFRSVCALNSFMLELMIIFSIDRAAVSQTMAEKILVVDDDIDSLKLIGLMLQRNGYEVVAANSGTQALTRAAADKPDRNHSPDIMMPDMNGYEVVPPARRNQETAGIPIIMFTAKTLIDDKVAGFEAGADDYLTKPTHPAELASRVKAILMRSTAAPIDRVALQRRDHRLFGGKGQRRHGLRWR
ncbi:MAG: response regulator [Anaerolineae bacterium]